MREIKFRAWDPDEKVMMYDDETAAHKMGYWDGVNTSPISMINTQLKEDSLIPDIYMQYTGLKDANGIEIYEGDIVRILYTDWPSNPAPNNEGLEEYKKSISNIGEVVYSNLFGDAQYEIAIQDFRGPIAPGPHGEIEVIGNIYENPELLKGA